MNIAQFSTLVPKSSPFQFEGFFTMRTPTCTPGIASPSLQFLTGYNLTGRAEKELAESEVVKEGMGWGLGELVHRLA